MGRRRKGGPPRGPGRPRADPRVDRWLRGAFDAHRAGNLRGAEKLARRVLGAVPDQPDALHLLATVARESGRADLAVDLYRRLLRRHPAIPVAQNSLGNMLQERGEWGPAIECYEAAVAHDPRYVNAYFNLGQALLRVGVVARAQTCLRHAADLAPNDTQVRSSFARVLAELGRSEEAVTEALRAVELDPASAVLRNDLGTIQATMGAFDAARECYRTALVMEPGYAKAAVNLAKIKRFTAEDDPDAALILAAAGHAPGDRDSRRDLHLALGKIHDDRGDWDAAFTHYDEANRPFAEVARADADTSLGLMDQVRAFFDAGWFAGRAGEPGTDPVPVFIVGMPRSGTSLVEQILAAHPAVHGAGELSEIGRMVADIASRADASDPYPGCMRSLDAEAVRALGRRYVAHLRTHSPDAARVTEKLPGNYLHLGFIATILPGRQDHPLPARPPRHRDLALLQRLRVRPRLLERSRRHRAPHPRHARPDDPLGGGARRAHARSGLRDPGRGPGARGAQDGRARRPGVGRRVPAPTRGLASGAHREQVAGPPTRLQTLGRTGPPLRAVPGSVAGGAGGAAAGTVTRDGDARR